MLEVYNYDPNFLFSFNKFNVGRVKLIFCIREKENYPRQHILFILQNGFASTINEIEVIASQVQKEILNKLSLCIVNDFEVYIVNPNKNGTKKVKDLTSIKFPDGLDRTVTFSGDINFKDLGITKDELADTLNEYIADSYLPYQLLNPKLFIEDFNDNSTYYVKNLLLYLFLREVKNTNYTDKVFKSRLRQISIAFVKSLDDENTEVSQSLFNSKLSSLKSEDGVNSDCYDELEKIFDKFTKNYDKIKEEFV
ncbi:hypothetical protein [Bacillus sp. AK128]